MKPFDLEKALVGEPEIDPYDAGFLNDFGGGNVGWWHDYIRAELDRAYEFYLDQLAAAPQPAPDVAGLIEPVAFCEDAALSIAERTFSTEVDEHLAEDVIQYARRLHELYTAPQPGIPNTLTQGQQTDVTQLVEALDITELLKLLLILRGNIGGAMWTLDDEEEELALRTEKAMDALDALAAWRERGNDNQ